MSTNFTKLGLSAVLTLGFAAATMAPANADPSTFQTYAGVGSDTTQDVWNALANNGEVADTGSYDAFGTSTIQTKAAGATFTRPQGSGEGVKALSAVWDPTYSSHAYQGTALTHGEVDFARSSSGPSGSTDDLRYLPMGRDAVSVALKPNGALTTLNLSTNELKEIYSGSDTDPNDQVTITGSGSSAVVKINGVTVHPQIPQQGSGTRKFFLGAIGVTTLAAYISDPALPAGHHENDGTELTNPGDLIPFSAAQWIAQARGVTAPTISGLSIAAINGQQAVTGTGTASTPGPLYGDPSAPPTSASPFARDVYNVIPKAFETGTASQQALYANLTGSAPGQLGSGSAQSVVQDYGFELLSYFGDPAQEKPGSFQH